MKKSIGFLKYALKMVLVKGEWFDLYEYINHAYEKYGNVREAAESLGMTPSTFVRKRQKYTKNVD